MAKSRSRGAVLRGKWVYVVAALVLLVAVYIWENGLTNYDMLPEAPAITAAADALQAVFLPVGKADAIILRSGEHTMVVDCGEAETKEYVAQCLRTLGVTTIDVLVGTHPDSDHIGGMAYIVEQFDIGTVVMPDRINTTRTFENVVLAMQKKGLQADVLEPGDTFALGAAQCEVLGPVRDDYNEDNNFSIVLKVTIGARSMLLTGDAESPSEKDMLASGRDLSAEVLKVGHHGSDTSSKAKFLDAVQSEIAIICCDQATQPKHPNQKVLNRLEERMVTILRTDYDGPLCLTTNGITEWQILRQWEGVPGP